MDVGPVDVRPVGVLPAGTPKPYVALRQEDQGSSEGLPR